MTTGRRLRASVALLLLLLAPAACGGEASSDVIDREVFVSTFVALRAARLEQPDRAVGAPERARVLEAQGVTEEELLRFAEVHGGDIDYMDGVWSEVERRMAALEEGANDPEG